MRIKISAKPYLQNDSKSIDSVIKKDLGKSTFISDFQKYLEGLMKDLQKMNSPWQ